MRITDLINDKEKLNKYYQNYINRKLILKSSDSSNLTKAHIKKAEHNLEFVNTFIKNTKFNDWVIVSLYYTLYHSFLALIEHKSYSSKNHNATIVFILKNYVQIDIKELELLEKLQISKEDAKFYTQLKEDRNKASYSTDINFDKENIENLNRKVKLLLLKIKHIVQEN